MAQTQYGLTAWMHEGSGDVYVEISVGTISWTGDPVLSGLIDVTEAGNPTLVVGGVSGSGTKRMKIVTDGTAQLGETWTVDLDNAGGVFIDANGDTLPTLVASPITIRRVEHQRPMSMRSQQSRR